METRDFDSSLKDNNAVGQTNKGIGDQIFVSFDISTKEEMVLNSLEPLRFEEKISLTIIFNYDVYQSHQMSQIYNILGSGILSETSRIGKFLLEMAVFGLIQIKIFPPFSISPFAGRLEMDFSSGFSFNPYVSDTDDLLQLLSLLNDALNLLKNEGAKLNFTFSDIIDNLAKAFENRCSKDECTDILNRLIKLKSTNPNLPDEDAILLLYCFNPIRSFDPSLFNFSGTFKLDDLISTAIDKLFKMKFEKRTLLIDELYQKQMYDLQKQVGTEFLKRINLWQRIKLYSPCLGKLADGYRYDWNSTEWYFIRHTKFSLDKLGNVYIDIIKEINQNSHKSGYLTHYATNKHDPAKFGNQLTTVAKHINLAFADDVKWHEKITFKLHCARDLFKRKLHLDVDTFKLLLKAKNNYLFFRQVCADSLFSTLPGELNELIFNLANLGPILPPAKELESPKQLARTLMSF